MLLTSFAYMPATALATVSVPDRQCKARVLMDIGSGITLISSRLAQSLKAKKQCLVHEITGLNRTKCLTSKHVIKGSYDSRGSDNGYRCARVNSCRLRLYASLITRDWFMQETVVLVSAFSASVLA